MTESVVAMMRTATRCVASILVVACLSLACSEGSRYRVLTFFFDGVPEPGQVPTPGYAVSGTAGGGGGEQAGEDQAPIVVLRVSHPPYRDNRCGACHDSRSGRIPIGPAEGLCLGCHPSVPGAVKFVHGPVATRDCLFCHHPHASAHAALLLTDSTSTCLRCHDQDDLGEGPHHADLTEQTCVECHGAHGGDDRFFLKRVEP